MSVSLPNVEPAPEYHNSPASLNGVGILVVDEDPAFQLGLKTFLKEYVGFENVFTAKSGAEALDLIEKEESIEIVTLDYQMPGMNGIDVLRRLNDKTPRPLSVLMITGYPSDQLREEFEKLGTPDLQASHFLSKPVEFEDLEPLILRSYEELKAAQRLATAMAEEEARKKAAEVVVDDVRRPPTEPISPIAAAALLAADPTQPIPPIETALSPEIVSKIDNLTTKIDRLESEVTEMKNRTPNLQSRFWMDILKLIALGALIFLALQFGLFQKLEEWIQPAKSALMGETEPAGKGGAGKASEKAKAEPAPAKADAAPKKAAPAPKAEAKGKAKEPAPKSNAPTTPKAENGKGKAKAPAPDPATKGTPDQPDA
ncbi:MAG: response regulator [Verrucomicrobiales bacterium]|nr:response regulator [Verrucomicrobiales bacterium]